MGVQSWAPSPCAADGGSKSHGVTVCNPRQQQQQQQQLQQQLQQEVEEKADVGVIGNQGKHVCTFRDNSHGRQPCARYLGLFGAAKPRGIIAPCILLLEN